MTESQKIRIKRCSKLAQMAMERRKYNLAHRLIDEIPSGGALGVIGVKMKLLIIEHENNYSRRK